MAEILKIPAKNPVVHTYDNVAVRRAVNEGLKKSNIYLAVALQKIADLPPIVEMRGEIDDRIESLSSLWGLKEDKILKLIEKSCDDVDEKRFVRVNEKIHSISDRMNEIAYELSANRLKRIMYAYPNKKEIFVNVEPEHLCIFDELGIGTESLFYEVI